MNKHSKTYEEKKTELAELEKEIRKELDDESRDVESSLVNVLKVAAIASTAILIGYGVYRWTRGGEEEPEEGKNADSGKLSGFFEKAVDKVTDVVTGLVVQNISNYLDKLKEDVTSKR